ncbi:uncharacterized protein J3R85_005278 [Psidium guajava]|nr:uncharacterized protein J3R85_005278 [Psidium guajava]
MNIDASFDAESRSAVVAGILRDKAGILIEGFAKKVAASTPLQAEAMALLEAVTFLRSRRLEDLHLESDSRVVVEAVLDQSLIPWEIEATVREARAQLDGFSKISVAAIVTGMQIRWPIGFARPTD